MGQICSSDNYPESKKIFNSFKKMQLENKFDFTIHNYDNICQKIKSLSKNYFEKLGQMQQLRIDFIEQIRQEINITNENYYYNAINYNSIYSHHYNSYNYMQNINNFNFYNINENEKILFFIIIMTLTLKSYLKKNYVSNELEKSLLELSIIILKKNYSKNVLKLILYYLSRLFEILFIKFHNSQNYININDYLKKVSYISNDCNILTEGEKYQFIFSHILFLAELFKNDYHNILINSENQALLMKYYTYLIAKNYDFIIQYHSTYKKILMNKKNHNYCEDLTNSKYNKNDLIEIDQFSENLMKKSKEYDDLTKISCSNLYFLIICSQDTFTGKDIFFEFDKYIESGIKDNNFENEKNLIKFKEAYFMILFSDLKPTNFCSTMLLSFYEYLINNHIQSNDIYDEMIISLYDNFNNNKIFIDKYLSIISRIFIFELENYKKEKFIIDKLYNYIYNLYNNKYNINLESTNQAIFSKNLYFFLNLIRHISFYYNKIKNIKIAYDILIYFTNYIDKIRFFLKKPMNLNKNNIGEIELQDNFILTLNNFDYNKNDFYTSLNESIQIPLSNFLSNYIIFVNDFFNIKQNEIANNFDYSIITTITYLEIGFIKKNKKKNITIIIKLLSIYIGFLNTSELIDNEEVKGCLNNNLKIILNEISVLNYEIFNKNIKYNTFHLKLIYSVIMSILIKIEEKNFKLTDLVKKHYTIINIIKKYDNALCFKCFPNLEKIQSFTFNNIIVQLSNIEEFIIQKLLFQQIINIIKKNLFNDEDIDSDISFNIYRTRTIYQRDKNDINININTNKHEQFSNQLPMFLNDSLSNYSNNSIRCNRSYLNIPQNTVFNNSYYSEGVNLPYKGYNEDHLSDQKRMSDIISDKNSSNFNLKL